LETRFTIRYLDDVDPKQPVAQLPVGWVVKDILPNGKALYLTGGPRGDAIEFQTEQHLDLWHVWGTYQVQKRWGPQASIGRLFQFYRHRFHRVAQRRRALSSRRLPDPTT
jgi:hypothetical protein